MFLTHDIFMLSIIDAWVKHPRWVCL